MAHYQRTYDLAPHARWLLLLALAASAGLLADDWPQWRGPQRDGVWRETGILDRFPAGGLTFRWRTPIGPGYAGPAVSDGKVYVLDRQKENETERILCLDARTGRILWTHVYPCRYRKVGYPAGPRATPTVAGGKVYALGTMGQLHEPSRRTSAPRVPSRR